MLYTNFGTNHINNSNHIDKAPLFDYTFTFISPLVLVDEMVAVVHNRDSVTIYIDARKDRNKEERDEEIEESEENHNQC